MELDVGRGQEARASCLGHDTMHFKGKRSKEARQPKDLVAIATLNPEITRETIGRQPHVKE